MIETLKSEVVKAVGRVVPHGMAIEHMMALGIVGLTGGLVEAGYSVSAVMDVAAAGTDGGDPVGEALAAMEAAEAGGLRAAEAIGAMVPS